MRQIVLDTETTGLESAQGHRIIEIGCIELVNRRQTGNNFHTFLNPDRDIESGAEAVHGITNAMLADKPRFADIVDSLVEYLRGAELVIHNADFDIGFLDVEIARLKRRLPRMGEICTVLDTLALARRVHPGQRNTLDALCKRYMVDNSRREFHGALLDAQLLAEVYLGMTGGQASMTLEAAASEAGRGVGDLLKRLLASGQRPVVLRASTEEAAAHQRRLDAIDKASKGRLLWR